MPQTSAMLKPRETAEIARGERALVYRSGNVVRRVYAASQGDPQVDFYLLRIASALFPGKFLEPVRFTLPSGRTFLGSKPNKAVKGSGSIARKALQQLEAAKLVQNVQSQGRIVTPQGRSLLDNAAHAARKDLEKTVPALSKY